MRKTVVECLSPAERAARPVREGAREVRRVGGGRVERPDLADLRLPDGGSFIEIEGLRWALEPAISSSCVEGSRWYVRGRDGKRTTSIYLTPDGRLGTRLELRLRFRSQRLWTEKKQTAWQRMKVIERLEGPTSFEWVAEHPAYSPRRKRLMRATTYRKLMARLETHR